ncbi:Predicted nucleic acid-binding protein, contains PIN domain [Parafrankia irregularis]|uniref:Ribonuclease VapC n=1 Tax=Parafrankia irregularis TaxID=795642 RepID=A0A0S4QVF4_9ACTN|nr:MULTISPECIES: type II toxin-antitoxin system VapC family toxin [Parafrankia]CUU59070.1 Predicted nucleic acid-binding protein, contains PIN domain [Parafrankia irregularis]
MGLIVVDASVIVDLLAGDDSPRRKAARDRLTGGDASYAPAHLDIEVISALRGLARRTSRLAEHAPNLIASLIRLPIRREPLSGPTAQRVWELRQNMTAYDAGYVALAEQIDAVLLTCDAKYAAAAGPRCAIELIT